jgi:hypothetical protein
MSRSVVFNGITRFSPGGIVKINSDALNQVSFVAPNIIALLGEADGGAPGTAGIVSLRDPAKAASTFKAGPLVDAITAAFQSSGDTRIPGGASEVLVYKTNASTQSTVHIPDPSNSVLRDVAAASSTTTVVKMTSTGITASQMVGRWVSVGINSLPVSAALTATGGTDNTATVATTADAYVGKMIQFATATTTAALQDEYAIIIANSGTVLTFDRVLPAVVANTDTFDVLSTSRVRVVSHTDGSGAALTVTPALPAAPALGDGVYVHATLALATTKDYGLHTAATTLDVLNVGSAYKATVDQGGTSQSSENIGGSNALQLTYSGGANAVSSDTVTTPTATTATTVTLTTGGLTSGAHDGATVTLTNPATGLSEQVKTSTNTATVLTLESPGLSADFLTEVQAAGAGTVIVDISTVTDAYAVIIGVRGEAANFSTYVTGVTGDNLSIAINSSTTLQQLVDSINANTNYLAAVPSGIDSSLLASDLDFTWHTQVNIQKDIAVNGGVGFRRDLQEFVDWFATNSTFLSVERHAVELDDGGYLGPAALTESTFATPLPMTGGTRGASTNSSFQAGFDALLLEKGVALVVPLIDQNLSVEALGSTATWASVSAQLAAHVTAARGAAGTERGGHIGFRGTKTAIIAAANTLNDKDVQLCAQLPTVLDATGTLRQFGPRMEAVMAASMRAGVSEVGEPLTHKFLRVSALTQDASWDPTDATDAADLIKAGVLFATVVPGKGTRWERDLTTWVKDDNLACVEGSVRSIVRTVAKGARDILDDRFTGRKASPATVGAVRDTMASLLNTYRDEGLIVDSTDPATGAVVRAWHSLRVFTDGDVLRVNVGIFPVPGINFELTEIFLQMPTQSAA